MPTIFRRGDRPTADGAADDSNPAEPAQQQAQQQPEGARPEPPAEANHLVVVVLDSLRYDSAAAAEMATLARLGELEARWSYASWTAPSHYNLLMGLLPHRNPTHVYASEYYKEDFLRYRERLGVSGIEFKSLLPSIFLPTYLRNQLGYATAAHVSMPVLNRHVPLNQNFDHYTLMPKHNDMAAMVDDLRFDGDRPWFHLLNVGETHYPYALPSEDPAEWPRISGVHGVFKHLDEDLVESELRDGVGQAAFFDDEQLARLRSRQVDAARYLDGVLERLFDLVPRNTWIVVTADHGELFGEQGFFGHGPVSHPKVFEVPFVEGKLR